LEVVTSYAISYPAIMFNIISDGKALFKAPAATGMRERAVAVFGLETAREMVRVEDRREDMLVEGLITKPHVTRSKHSSLTFVNRRFVVSKVLKEAITAAYGPMVTAGRHPIAVLNIIMDPKDVDVNVHPAKTEVRFVDGLKVYDIVYRAVHKALQTTPLVPEVADGDLGAPKDREKGRGQAGRAVATGAGTKVTVRAFKQDVLVDAREVSENRGGTVAAPTERLPLELKVVGQISDLYIVCEGKDGIVIIDQHAAHEKIVYERLMDAMEEGGGIGTQELVVAYVFELPAREAEDMRRHIETLAGFGFGVEEFGERTFRVRHVPSVMGMSILPDAVKDMLADILECEKGTGKGDERLWAMRDRVVATMACHTAVRGGRTLEFEEMRSIVKELYSAKDPYACPHGRPTIVSMPFTHLERRFGRRT
jgi:DNA mismatch repair protein MutL